MLQSRLRFTDIDWLDLRAIAQHSPPTSALYRAVHPESWVTPEVSFLRDIEYSLRWLVWAKTTDGEKGLNRPQPVLLTDAEREAFEPEKTKYDARPMAETLAFLGWTPDQLN